MVEGAARGGVGLRDRIGLGAADVLLFVLAAWICLLYRPLDRPIAADNQIYFYIAERVASGEPPHLSLVDHKHQLSTLLSGAAIKLARSFDVPDYVGARILSIPVAAACVPLVRSLATATGAGKVASLLAGLVMVGFVDFLYHGTMGVRPKVFMAFFLVLSLRGFALRHYLRAGAAAAASFLCWQPALIVYGGLAAGSACLRERRMRALFMVGVGSFAALAAYEFYFLAAGALREQLYQSYRMPADSGGYTGYAPWSTVKFLFAMGLWRKDFGTVISGICVGGLPLMWLYVGSGRGGVRHWLSDQPGAVATIVAGHGALAFTFVDRQAYPDMFFLYPFMAMFAATILAAGLSTVKRRLGVITQRVSLALAVVFLAWLPFHRMNLFALKPRPISEQIDAAKQLDLLREQFGPVWVVGAPHLLAYTRTRNHTKFGLLIDPKVRGYMQSTAAVEGRWRPYSNGVLPGVILLSRGGYGGELFKWINREYREFEMKALNKQGIKVWVARRDPDQLDPQ